MMHLLRFRGYINQFNLIFNYSKNAARQFQDNILSYALKHLKRIYLGIL
jgi:hypothetical protein